jgi:putative copper resistance protein D
VIDGALAAARAAHFAGTLLLEGMIAFDVLVAGPALGGAADVRMLKRPLNWVAPGAFLVAILSGAAWLVLLAAELGGSSVASAMADGTAWLLLTQTQFGIAWQARAAGFLLLALCMLARKRTSDTAHWTALVISIGLAGSIAWSGHGAATPGVGGIAHLALDFAHLAAAGLWVGGLLPFALLLLNTNPDTAGRLSHRFSALATAGVLILLPTGIANGWFALPGVDALTTTLYGKLLLAKIALFVLMLAFAAVNRFVLIPQLAHEGSAGRGASRLAIHSGSELALGLIILAIVGVLGILDPGGHNHSAAAPRHTAASTEAL